MKQLLLPRGDFTAAKKAPQSGQVTERLIMSLTNDQTVSIRSLCTASSFVCTLDKVAVVGLRLYVYLSPGGCMADMLPPMHFMISKDDDKKAGR